MGRSWRGSTSRRGRRAPPGITARPQRRDRSSLCSGCWCGGASYAEPAGTFGEVVVQATVRGVHAWAPFVSWHSPDWPICRISPKSPPISPNYHASRPKARAEAELVLRKHPNRMLPPHGRGSGKMRVAPVLEPRAARTARGFPGAWRTPKTSCVPRTPRFENLMRYPVPPFTPSPACP